MNNIKNEIKKKVQDVLCDVNWNTVVPVFKDKVNETRRISDSETAILICTPNGTRWFIVKVKELMS